MLVGAGMMYRRHMGERALCHVTCSTLDWVRVPCERITESPVTGHSECRILGHPWESFQLPREKKPPGRSPAVWSQHRIDVQRPVAYFLTVPIFVTMPGEALNAVTWDPSVTFQTRTSPSYEPAATRLPSALNVSANT